MRIFQRVPRPDEHPFGREVPYASRDIGKALASGKLVAGNCSSEGSQPANSGTDEQESHRRLDKLDKQAHHCDVQKPEREVFIK